MHLFVLAQLKVGNPVTGTSVKIDPPLPLGILFLRNGVPGVGQVVVQLPLSRPGGSVHDDLIRIGEAVKEVHDPVQQLITHVRFRAHALIEVILGSGRIERVDLLALPVQVFPVPEKDLLLMIASEAADGPVRGNIVHGP